jgi:hypothetical protein
LQGSLLQVEVSEIVVHEADEPNALVDFLDAESLDPPTRSRCRSFAMRAEPSAGGDERKKAIEKHSIANGVESPEPSGALHLSALDVLASIPCWRIVRAAGGCRIGHDRRPFRRLGLPWPRLRSNECWMDFVPGQPSIQTQPALEARQSAGAAYFDTTHPLEHPDATQRSLTINYHFTTAAPESDAKQSHPSQIDFHRCSTPGLVEQRHIVGRVA